MPVVLLLSFVPPAAHGWSIYTDYCAVRGDDAELPADPRGFATVGNEIYNTHVRGKSNAGRTFTSVLTDEEREKLIEFLKDALTRRAGEGFECDEKDSC